MTTLRTGLKIKQNGEICELLERVNGEGMVRQLWLVRYDSTQPPRLDYIWLLTYQDLQEELGTDAPRHRHSSSPL